MLPRRPTSEEPGRRRAGVGVLLAVAVVAVALLLDPGRDDGAPGSTPPDRSTSAPSSSSALSAGREFCDAYVAVTRASDQFLAEGTPRSARGLEQAVADLVPVAVRTELSDEERAGLVLVVGGLVTAAGIPEPDLSARRDLGHVPFAAASTAFGSYLARRCGAQLGAARPGAP